METYYLRLIMVIANKESAITFPRIMSFPNLPTMHFSIKIETTLFTFLIVSEQKCAFMRPHSTDNNANDRTEELMIIVPVSITLKILHKHGQK
jgi:hypothetical protein